MHFHIAATRVGEQWLCAILILRMHKGSEKILLHDVMGIWAEKGCLLKLLGLSWNNVEIEKGLVKDLWLQMEGIAKISISRFSFE